MFVWSAFLTLLVYVIWKMASRVMYKKREEERRLEEEERRRQKQEEALRQKQEREKAAEQKLALKLQAIAEQQEKRNQLLREKGAAFSQELAEIPRVEVVLQPSPVLPSRSPVWSLFTYRNVTKASRLDTLGDFITVDVETTGLNPEVHEIIQLSAVTFRDFEPINCFTTYIRPENGINAKAASINHITEETVADAPALSEIRSAFRSYVGEELPIIGHNLEFDLKILVLCGCLAPDASRRYYDTLDLSRRTWKQGPYKLDALGENVLGIARSDAHTALSDAYLTGLLFKEICRIRTSKQ